MVSARPIRAGVSPLHRADGGPEPEEARWDDSSAAPHQARTERFRDSDR